MKRASVTAPQVYMTSGTDTTPIRTAAQRHRLDGEERGGEERDCEVPEPMTGMAEGKKIEG